MPSPQEVLDAALSGDTVRITLRGPASEEEVDYLMQEYKKRYPALNFEIRDQGVVSSAELIRPDPNPAPDVPSSLTTPERIVRRSFVDVDRGGVS